MPLLPSSFHPPAPLRSAHAQTIIPSLFRRPYPPTTETRHHETNDGDLLLYRLYKNDSKRLAIISHGLEGSFDSSYVQGMVLSLRRATWDVLTWNMRGCGDIPNRLVTWYHSGKSDDLKSIISIALTLPYEEIALIGFSVGGNITLKYLGEEGGSVPSKVSSAVTISVPMDLRGSAEILAKKRNSIYMQYLLRPLRRRMRAKKAMFPEAFDITALSGIRAFYEFDRRFTAPFHGFSSVEEYWEKSSSRRYLHSIAIPTLALSAHDDPFLSPSCLPHDIARLHPHLFLETPQHGGHVGFIDSLTMKDTWAERRALEFISRHASATTSPERT
jgi:predicted alpha/beta-fold hydrolase